MEVLRDGAKLRVLESRIWGGFLGLGFRAYGRRFLV